MEKGKKVLHIEDDQENRRLVRHIVEEKNLQYYFAENGLKGLRLAEKIEPELILIDIVLPDLQGYEITTYLKNLPELSETNIIAVTGHTDAETRSLSKAAGCDDFIAKPFEVDTFSEKLDLWLSGKIVSKETPSLELLQKYNTRLVSKLISKITDLEELNSNLRELNKKISKSKKELEIYNDRLLYLNRLTNFFHEHKNPSELLQLLPTKIVEAFPVSRCIFFGIVNNKSLLKPFSYALIKEEYPDPPEINIEPELLKRLSDSDNIVFVENITDETNPQLRTLSGILDSKSFILAKLSGSNKDIIAEISQTEDNVVRKEKTQTPTDIIIFIEPKSADYLFSIYEMRIIESFLQTIKNVFENSILFDYLMELYKEREEEAIRDGLTKIYNFRYFMQAIEREINRGRRFNGNFSLLMIDIDYFKAYNDRLGHLKGDRVLCTLSNLIEINTRQIDIVSRYGGEEFTVILPGIEKENALIIASKLRELIEHYNFPEQEGQPSGNLTISVGLASFPDDAKTAKELIDKADKALYKAKESGRNRVCVYGIDVK
jgi:diguanylate cyclase (GGDEF)-like protein